MFRSWRIPLTVALLSLALAVAVRGQGLVRFDPKAEKFQSWAIPSGVGIIRHMRRTPDGNLAIHQSSTNRIGLAIIGKQATATSR
jgi:hypothetical protein